MLKKIRRVVMWIISNGLLITFGSLGMFLKVQWCENIFLFFIYLVFVITLIGVANKEAREKVQKQGWSVPKWISIFVDLIIVGMLAAAGRFFTAIIWFIQMTLEYGMHENKIEGDTNGKV